MTGRTWLALAGIASLLAGCGAHFKPVSGQLSPLPVPPATPDFKAGFGRADITPPPGVGLAGNGPEGNRAMGHRLRLYARALVLEDATGNRLALVVADLPLGSALLHRRIADSIHHQYRIGVDRLIVSATHTHSGPSHYFEGGVYNAEGSAVPGYDPRMVDSLTVRIVRAIGDAVANLAKARVAWGSQPIWGLTRIRSLPAMRRNIPPPTTFPGAPADLLEQYRFVDPELSMLRVDLYDSVAKVFRPTGAFSVFAMHATGNASGTELLDADIHGIVERRLERHIDSLNKSEGFPFVPRAFHLFANGTEGDVSPAWTPQSRCDVPVLAPLHFLDGPFDHASWQWSPHSTAHLAGCIHAARQGVEVIGDSVGKLAIRLFDGLEPALVDRMELARAYQSIPLKDAADSLGICREPAVGMQALVGADDAHTRMNGVELFGLFPIGFKEGSINVGLPGCHKQKHRLLDALAGGKLNTWFVADQLPRFAQVTVFRIGDRLIGTLPGEVTTMAGRRMRREMLDSARARNLPVTSALIVGLTNGYLEYVTTAEEYTAQYYEGGSTLYGPGEAAMFGRAFATLVTKLGSGNVLSEAVTRLEADPGKEKRILRDPSDPTRKRATSIQDATCRGDTLYVDFKFGTVRDWPSADGSASRYPRVTVFQGTEIVSWDDDPKLELHARSLRKDPAQWQLRWSGAKPGRKYSVRVHEGAESREVQCP